MKTSGIGKMVLWLLGAYVYASLVGGRLPYFILYTSIGVYLISFLWTITLGKIDARAYLQSNRSDVGREVILKIKLINKSVFPIPWIHCRMKLPEIFGPDRKEVAFGVSMKSRQSLELDFPLECQIRGFFQWGSMLLSTGDIFGILTRKRNVETRLNLLVRPRVYYLGKNCLSGIDKRPGDRGSSFKPGRQVSEFRGVRAYNQGDSLSRIHWKASVRAQRFLVKEYDRSILNEMLVFIDMSSAKHSGEGYNSSVESAVNAAASLAATAIQEGLNVGCAVCSDDLLVVPPARSKGHLGLILDFLARAVKAQGIPMEKALLQKGVEFPRGTLLALFTPSFDQEFVDTVALMVGKGHKIFIGMIKAESFGSCDIDLQAREQALSRLAHYGVQVLLIDSSSDLRALFGGINYEAC